jgi:hypothetical protein
VLIDELLLHINATCFNAQPEEVVHKVPPKKAKKANKRAEPPSPSDSAVDVSMRVDASTSIELLRQQEVSFLPAMPLHVRRMLSEDSGAEDNDMDDSMDIYHEPTLQEIAVVLAEKHNPHELADCMQSNFSDLFPSSELEPSELDTSLDLLCSPEPAHEQRTKIEQLEIAPLAATDVACNASTLSMLQHVARGRASGFKNGCIEVTLPAAMASRVNSGVLTITKEQQRAMVSRTCLL